MYLPCRSTSGRAEGSVIDSKSADGGLDLDFVTATSECLDPVVSKGAPFVQIRRRVAREIEELAVTHVESAPVGGVAKLLNCGHRAVGAAHVQHDRLDRIIRSDTELDRVACTIENAPRRI